MNIMNYSPEKCLEELKAEFPSFNFDFREENIGGIISLFFIESLDESELSKYWDDIVVFISTSYQVNLNDEFSIWNIYLIFLADINVSKELKYKIENDTFSSRKIVVDKNEEIEKIISDHILNDNMKILYTTKRSTNLPNYQNLVLARLLKGVEPKIKANIASKDLF